jgi:hypothetical protein
MPLSPRIHRVIRRLPLIRRPYLAIDRQHAELIQLVAERHALSARADLAELERDEVQASLSAMTQRAEAVALYCDEMRASLSETTQRAEAVILERDEMRASLSETTQRAEAVILERDEMRASLSETTQRAEAVILERDEMRASLSATTERAEALATLAYAEERECDELRKSLSTAVARANTAERKRDILQESLSGIVERAHSIASLTHTAVDSTNENVAILSAKLTDYADLLLRRFAESQERAVGSINLLSANVAASVSQQENNYRSLRNRLTGQSTGLLSTDLYLDLLEGSLTGTVHPDESSSPWVRGKQDAARRGVGQDWPSRAETMIGTARMRNIRMLVHRALEESVSGDLIETGAWRGGACIYMRGILAAACDTKRRVFVADSFCGLPSPDEAIPADAGDAHHTFPELAVSRAEVESNFRRYGLLDEQVIFLEGWFKDTLPNAPIDRLAVLRLDGDMYGSTMDALNALYAKVSHGGFVIVDDYVLKPCAQAVDDFRQHHGIAAPLNDVDGAAVWWQVP